MVVAYISVIVTILIATSDLLFVCYPESKNTSKEYELHINRHVSESRKFYNPSNWYDIISRINL